MRKLRLVGFVFALAVGMIGASMLLLTVQTADERARAEFDETDVFVVGGATTIPAGTPVDQIPFERRTIAANGVVPNAVRNVSSLAGLVTIMDLLPGDQVRADRFGEEPTAADSELEDQAPSTLVPDGLLEITIALDGPQALGGRLLPGESVAVITSFSGADLPEGSVIPGMETPDAMDAPPPATPEPTATPDVEEDPPQTLAFAPAGALDHLTTSPDVEGLDAGQWAAIDVPDPTPEPSAEPEPEVLETSASGALAEGEDAGDSTHLILPRILVTAVQTDGGPLASGAALGSITVDADGEVEEEDRAEEPSAPGLYEQTTAPAGDFLISLAVSPAEAERIIFAIEWGSVWLARSNDGADPNVVSPQTLDSIYFPTADLAPDSASDVDDGDR